MWIGDIIFCVMYNRVSFQYMKTELLNFFYFQASHAFQVCMCNFLANRLWYILIPQKTLKLQLNLIIEYKSLPPEPWYCEPTMKSQKYLYTSISASLHCWGRLNCTTSWSKNFSGLMLLANPGTNTVFHNAGFSLALLSTFHALKPFCNCIIWGMDSCRRYFMQMNLQIKMIYLLIQSTSINNQKANTTTATNIHHWIAG